MRRKRDDRAPESVPPLTSMPAVQMPASKPPMDHLPAPAAPVVIVIIVPEGK